MKEKHVQKNKKMYYFIVVIRVILMLIIVACSIYILLWYNENKRNAKMLSKIVDESIIDTVTVELPVINDETNNQEDTIEISAYELNFPKLLSQNSSTVGWLTVPNTSINYPVVQATNNDFYLNHSFDKSYNSAGWIFADYRNSFDDNDKNIIIYGHNRMDSSMFATLGNTQKPNWYNNSENKYITFTTQDGVHVYEVFSIYTVKMETYYLTTDFNTDEEYLNFLNTIKSRSIHNYDTSLTESDKIITLSTCDATGRSRVILHAKQIL